MKSFGFYIIILIICIMSLAESAQADKMRIAVMDFKADGVSAKTAQRVAELIRNRMINTRKYVVVERKQMRMIIKEQGLQRTGCTDEDCAVKIGKLLSANKMLIGTVMNMGGELIITGRIVDVEKGVGEFSQDQSARSERDLYRAVKLFTEKLTKRIQGQAVAEDSSLTRQKYAQTRTVQPVSSVDDFMDFTIFGTAVLNSDTEINYSRIDGAEAKQGTYKYSTGMTYGAGLDYYFLIKKFDIGMGARYYQSREIKGEPLTEFSKDGKSDGSLKYTFIPFYLGMRLGIKFGSIRPFLVGHVGYNLIYVDAGGIDNEDMIKLYLAGGGGIILWNDLVLEVIYSKSETGLNNLLTTYPKNSANLKMNYIAISIGYNLL